MQPSNRQTKDILGVAVDAVTMTDVLSLIDERIASREPLLVGVVNVAKVVNMHRDPELGRSMQDCDIILADGMGIVWASRLLGRRLPERVSGIDLMNRLFERGHERGYRVYCLGATEEVSAEVARRVNRDHPNLQLVGRRNGYFSDDEREQVARDIAAARPDILFVAMTSPRKEVFLADFAEMMAVPVCHGVGGAFDVYAGKVKRAPVLWQRCGMEWLYRVVQEPRRMWKRYLVTNTLFLGMVLRELFRFGGPRTPSPSPQRPAQDDSRSGDTEHAAVR